MAQLSLVTLLELGGTAISTLGMVQAANAQAQQDLTNAAIAEQNAQAASFEAQVAAQEQDMAARDELGALLARSGASGLNLGSGSVFLQRKNKESLAALDRERIKVGGQVDAQNSRQSAAGFRASAKNNRRKGMFSLIGGGIQLGSSLIDSAARVDRKKASAITGRLGG